MRDCAQRWKQVKNAYCQWLRKKRKEETDWKDFRPNTYFLTVCSWTPPPPYRPNADKKFESFLSRTPKFVYLLLDFTVRILQIKFKTILNEANDAFQKTLWQIEKYHDVNIKIRCLLSKTANIVKIGNFHFCWFSNLSKKNWARIVVSALNSRLYTRVYLTFIVSLLIFILKFL